MQKNQKKKLWFGIALGTGVSGIALGAAFIILGFYALFGGKATVIQEVDSYPEILSEYTDNKTGYIVFPEQIPESAADASLYFYYKEAWDDPDCEFVLQCTYDEKDYEAEINRLQNTKKIYGSETRMLKFDDADEFLYPAYIAVLADAYTYEYALLTGENEITYVYLALRLDKESLHLSEDYLPTDYDELNDWEHDIWGESIYLESEDKDGNEVIGRSYDYSREEQVEKLQYHYENDGYNSFSVCTVLDENGKEIIKDCTYNYYKNRIDSLYGLPEEKVYTELGGYEYVSLELDEDSHVATVGYRKDGIECSMEYDYK